MSLLKVLGGVRPRSLVIAAAAINTANALGFTKDIVITSGNDAKHMKGSKHYSGEALDFRTKTLTDKELDAFTTALATRLGPSYQLILEDAGKANEHLHVERDVP